MTDKTRCVEQHAVLLHLRERVAQRLALLGLQLQGCELASDVDVARAARATEGYSGADIMCCCERAKQIPFREAVLNGVDRPLNRTDLETALTTVRPSVSRALLQRFEEYGR